MQAREESGLWIILSLSTDFAVSKGTPPAFMPCFWMFQDLEKLVSTFRKGQVPARFLVPDSKFRGDNNTPAIVICTVGSHNIHG